MNQHTRKPCTSRTIRGSIWGRTHRRHLLAIALASLIAASARAEFDLTAEFSPPPGLDGFQTWRITATSDLGNIVGFDFSSSGNYGITGEYRRLRFLQLRQLRHHW